MKKLFAIPIALFMLSCTKSDHGVVSEQLQTRKVSNLKNEFSSFLYSLKDTAADRRELAVKKISLALKEATPIRQLRASGNRTSDDPFENDYTKYRIVYNEGFEPEQPELSGGTGGLGGVTVWKKGVKWLCAENSLGLWSIKSKEEVFAFQYNYNTIGVTDVQHKYSALEGLTGGLISYEELSGDADYSSLGVTPSVQGTISAIGFASTEMFGTIILWSQLYPNGRADQ